MKEQGNMKGTQVEENKAVAMHPYYYTATRNPHVTTGVVRAKNDKQAAIEAIKGALRRRAAEKGERGGVWRVAYANDHNALVVRRVRI